MKRGEFVVEVVLSDLKSLIRTIPDYPKPGIMFRDVTTLFADPQGFKAAIAQIAEPFRTEPVDAVAGIEARSELACRYPDKLELYSEVPGQVVRHLDVEFRDADNR